MQINNLDSSKQGYVLGATDGERMFNSSGRQGLGFRAMCMPTGMR